MAEAEAHRREVFWIETVQESGQLAANPTKEIKRVCVRDHLDSQFFIDRAS